ERGAVTDVVRIIRRQSSVADLLRQPEPPEDFHASRRDMVAFRLGRVCRSPLLDHRDVNFPPRQIDRQREPDGPGANDQHFAMIHLSHDENRNRVLVGAPCIAHSGSAPESRKRQRSPPGSPTAWVPLCLFDLIDPGPCRLQTTLVPAATYPRPRTQGWSIAAMQGPHFRFDCRLASLQREK